MKVVFEDEDLEVRDIKLLSVEEAEKLPEEVRKFSSSWWLRSCGSYNDFATNVHYDGSVIYNGDLVDNDYFVVRPVLVINSFDFCNNDIDFLNLEIYAEIEYIGIKWIKISDNMLLCNDMSFGSHRFDEKSNKYETSEIKEYIYDKARELGIIIGKWEEVFRNKDIVVKKYTNSKDYKVLYLPDNQVACFYKKNG